MEPKSCYDVNCATLNSSFKEFEFIDLLKCGDRTSKCGSNKYYISTRHGMITMFKVYRDLKKPR